MANYGGGTQTPYHSVGSSLYGEKNELIAFKPQVLSAAANDWWYMTGSLDRPATLTDRERGLLFYNRKNTEVGYGRLCWIDEDQLPGSPNDFAWAVAGNRSAIVTGLWYFNPIRRSTAIPPAIGARAPFGVLSECAFDLANPLHNLVTNLNSEYVGGYKPKRFECADSLATAAENQIPVYKVAGRLTVGDPTDQCDAVNLRFFQGNQIGVTAMKPVQWATTIALSVTVGGGGTTLTSTGNALFQPDIDTTPGTPAMVGNVTESLAHRVLVKDQYTTVGGNNSAIPQGIYYVYNAGSGSSQYVLKRASDADGDGELAKGNLVFVEYGGVNRGSQYQCNDKSPLDGTVYGPAINPGVEPNWWGLFFRVSAYLQGRGMVLDGQTFHFAQKAEYPSATSAAPTANGSVFVVNGPSTLVPITPVIDASVVQRRYFGYGSLVNATLPTWSRVVWDDIDGKPTIVSPTHKHAPTDIIGGNALAVAYYGSDGILTAGSDLFTVSPASYVAIGKTLGSGPKLFYYNPTSETANTEILSWKASTGEVQRRTISSITDTVWAKQSGFVNRIVRWKDPTPDPAPDVPTEVSDTLENSILVEEPISKIIRPADDVIGNVALGTLSRPFTFVGGGANLGGLTLSVGLGTVDDTPGTILGMAEADTNRNVVRGFRAIPGSFVGLTKDAVGYGNASSKLTGDVTKLYFNGTQIRIQSGTKAAPSLAFMADSVADAASTCGIYRLAANALSIATNNVDGLIVSSSVVYVASHLQPVTNQLGSLGLSTNQWGSLFLLPWDNGSPLLTLAGWSSVGGTIANKVHSFNAASVRDWLGVSNSVIGLGTKDYFSVWVTPTQLGNAPFRLDNIRALNVSLRHVAPDTTNLRDLGYSNTLGGGVGSNLLSGNNSNFATGIGSWLKVGQFLTVTAVGGRMVIAMTSGGELTHGAELPDGILTAVAGKRYRISFSAKVDGAMPSITTQWVVSDTSSNLVFDSGQFFSPTTTDQTVQAFATAGSSTGFRIRFSENVGQNPYTVSIDNILIQEVTTGGSLTEYRWRNLFVHNIDVSSSFLPTADKGVAIGSTGDVLDTAKHRRFSEIYVGATAAVATPTALAGWSADPTANIPPVPLLQISKDQTLAFLGIGTGNVVTGDGNVPLIPKWTVAGGVLGDSEVQQPAGELKVVTDSGVKLGNSGFRWSEFWTKAAAGSGLSTLSGWDSDPDAAGTGAVMKRYDATKVRTWLGLGTANGLGTAHRLTKWDSSGGGPVDSLVLENAIGTPTAYGLQVLEPAYIDGLIEPFSHAHLATAPRPQIRAGFFTNQLANFDAGSPAVSTTGYPALVTMTMAGSVASNSTLGHWRCIYLPGGGGPTPPGPGYINGFRSMAPSWTGSGDLKFEFTCHRIWYSATTVWTPYILVRRSNDAALITAIKVEYRGGDNSTWYTSETQTPPKWSAANGSVWLGTDFTPTIIGNNILTGIRFTLTLASATDLRILEVGLTNLYWNPGAGVMGNLHTPNRWQQPNLFASYAATESGAGTTACGASGAPMIALWQSNTGLFSGTAGQIHFTTNGTWIAAMSSTGLSLGTSSITALLEFGSGSTGRAPIRFAAASNALLTTLVAGSFETDNNRLYFTNTVNSVATRHGLAMLDDYLQFTDPNAEMAGCVNFNSPYAGNHFAVANINAQVIGTGDFTVACRARFGPYVPVNNLHLWTLTSATGGGGGTAYDWVVQYNIGGALSLLIRDAAGVAGANAKYWTISVGTMAQFLGRIVDIVVIRTSGVVSIWMNGVNMTPAPSGVLTAFETQPVCNGLPLFFHVGAMHNTAFPWQERVYSARIFNRALPVADIVDLIRHGVDEFDKWSNCAAIYTSNFATADGWSQYNAIAAFNQSIGGRTPVAKLTGNNLTWAIISRSATVLTRNKRYRATGAHYIPTANPIAKRTEVGFFNNTATKIYLPQLAFDTWQTFDVESGRDNNVTGSNNAFEVGMLSAVGSQGATFTSSDIQYYHDVSLYLSGCFIDLDFGRVIGKQVWDWSGRYHATLSGTYEVVRPKFGTVTVPDGPGTITVNLRKFTQRLLTVRDNTAYPITHNLGITSSSFSVSAWELVMHDAPNAHLIKTAISLTVGYSRVDDNVMNVTFDSIGAPNPPGTVTKIVEVVIVA